MLNVAVLVSGGGTNLQAILDAKAAGALPHAVCLPAKRDPVYAGLVQYQIEKRVR